jgi:hypothetical protein
VRTKEPSVIVGVPEVDQLGRFQSRNKCGHNVDGDGCASTQVAPHSGRHAGGVELPAGPWSSAIWRGMSPRRKRDLVCQF